MLAKEKWFYFVGGKSASSIEELKDTLAQIDDSEFSFHVNSAKNDFANWIEGVFHKKDLADSMRRVLERKDTIAEIDRFLRKKMGEPEEIPADIIAPENYLNFDTLEPAAPEIPEPKLQPKLLEEQEDVAEPQKSDDAEELVPPKFDVERESELKGVIENAKKELHREGAKHERKDERFIVKEWIYGFIVGLIFGLIMLGILANLNECI